MWPKFLIQFFQTYNTESFCAQDTRPSWCPSRATREALTWLAEQGDVQNAVSMFLALAGGRNNIQDRVRDLIDNVTLEHWWLSYVDLLHRLQLFTKANEVKIYLTKIFAQKYLKTGNLGKYSSELGV